jgi:hypothetical protein
MSGGKGGSTTSQVQIPEYIEAAAQRNLNKAERISQLGYVPYYGPDVAALTPMQQASMQNVAGTAGAFGLSAPTGQDIYGMPAPTTYAGGIQGYSSAPMFEQAQAELARRRPAQKSYIDSFFIDPFTGAYGANVQAPIDYTGYATGAQQQRGQNGNDAAAAARLAATGGVGMAGGSGFTTYGGHRDVAHANINQSYIDYGKQISAGTAKPEDNPSYNPAIAAANKDRPITFMTDDGRTVTKTAGQLTEDDFKLASNDPATQYALAGASMAAGGVRNVGAGYAQDDPTRGVGGAFTDALGNVIETIAGTPTLIGQGLGLIDKPDSTYDPTGGGSTMLRPNATSPRPVLRPANVGTAKPSSTASTYNPAAAKAATANFVAATNRVNSIKDTTSPAYHQALKAQSKASKEATSANKKKDTVMCTAYCEMGYLSKDIWNLDRRYGVMMYRNDPNLIEGYHIWATPIADYIRKDTIPAKALRAVMWPIVKAWAEEMAHNMKPEEYKPNYFGKLIKFVGEPFSRMCGKLKPRKVEGVA